MTNIEYKIGKIEGELPHKFIVSLEDNALVFYAHNLFGENRLEKHSEIAEKYGLGPGKVMGGGEVDEGGRELELLGRSGNYGPVPKEILEKFSEQLLSTYQKIDENLETIDIGVLPLSRISNNHIQRKWKKYVEEK